MPEKKDRDIDEDEWNYWKSGIVMSIHEGEIDWMALAHLSSGWGPCLERGETMTLSVGGGGNPKRREYEVRRLR